MREVLLIVLFSTVLHRLDTFVRLRLMGMKGKVENKPLSEERAVEKGSEILSEAFLYSVAAGYIVFEYWRSVRKDQRKEEAQNHEIADLQVQTERLEQQMTQLQHTLDSLQTELRTHLNSHTSNTSNINSMSPEQSGKSKSWWTW